MGRKKKKPERGSAGMILPPREKMTVLMAPELMGHLEAVCGLLGLGKNGMAVMGISYLCASLEPVLRARTLSPPEVKALLETAFLAALHRESPQALD